MKKYLYTLVALVTEDELDDLLEEQIEKVTFDGLNSSYENLTKNYQVIAMEIPDAEGFKYSDFATLHLNLPPELPEDLVYGSKQTTD